MLVLGSWSAMQYLVSVLLMAREFRLRHFLLQLLYIFPSACVLRRQAHHEDHLPLARMSYLGGIKPIPWLAGTSISLF